MDIIVNHYGWKRQIFLVHIVDGRISYSYYNEMLDDKYSPTGEFDMSRCGYCSEGHLITWGSKLKD